ncbi:putative alpha beta hydrolase [Venustampulla echinocandica]|uniref:Putative alpha beta hydrolase n=1 Tax=Venustampulla echinocandica TaxID=2656787 RepID=A0A370TEY4_9HELO|nr:putative alpha beta hydrolase [Venustampulla echinocandica]RDL33252.1 putative alpha beta hydrolase [Venustampulla echinocandica]
MHHLFPRSNFFDFETIRILGTAVYGGADVAEVLEVVGQIKSEDPLSWEAAWHTQAERAEALAEEARLHGHRDAARLNYLKAANYTRASGYMYLSSPSSSPGDSASGLLVQDPRALPILEKVGELFRNALPLLDGKVHTLSIPYEEYTLPGYLYLPPPGRRMQGRSKIPILLVCGGADSCQEELYFMSPAAGPGLGYAVVTFDGPGQGLMLRKLSLQMRRDWEIVTGCVLDHLALFSAQHPELELDIDSISVSGASMGAYYALRAASDSRVKACVAIDPFYDMWDFGTAHVSPLFIKAWTGGWISSGLIDKIMGLLSKLSFQLRWEISVTGTFFGLTSPSEILLHMKRYTFHNDGGQGKAGTSFLSRITCPVLISGAGNSLYLDANHTKRCFMDLVNVPEKSKEYWVPASEGQGSLQAKMGALALCNQRTFQFLDKAFVVLREPL